MKGRGKVQVVGGGGRAFWRHEPLRENSCPTAMEMRRRWRAEAGDSE